MVFRKSKTDFVQGLGKNEKILYSFDFKVKKGFMKKEGKKIAFTNERFLIFGKGGGDIKKEYDLLDLTPVIKNKIIKKYADASVEVADLDLLSKTGEIICTFRGDADSIVVANAVNECKEELRRNASIPETKHDDDDSKEGSGNDPLTILKMRLVKGEIIKEEFDDMKGML